MSHKRFFLLLFTYCVLSIIHLLNAQNATIVLYEDFEKGIPADWQQEHLYGNYNWVIESGSLTNPVGATSGSKRIAFRNSTNQTTAYVTRLVLPAIDLSETFQPILCFSYAQQKWADDFDTLKILYRRTPKSNWVTLKTYDTYTSDWQRDTIRLAAVTSTYQIALEAKDNLGHGIVIDDIEVRSLPNCTQPFNLTTSQIKGTSVRLEWAGGFDALKYKVALSTKKLSLEALNAGIANNTTTFYEVNGENYFLEVDNLIPATHYFFYVQSECVGENSDWSDVATFATSDMLRLPYNETFDLDYIENTTSSAPNWFAYSSKRGAVPPFVNTNQIKSKRLAFSPDSTTALFFQGAYNTEVPITGSAYAYAVVPEIYIDSIKRLQASFWTINNPLEETKPKRDFSKILVGVMTDPDNKNTFVPVDTIEITTIQEFEEKFVSFENYKGDGKYITFMSDFKDGYNAFVIDNLNIDYIPAIPKAKITVALPEADALEVDFVEQSERYEVIISNSLLNVKSIDNKKVIKRQEFSSTTCRIEGLHPWVNYYVYGRHLNSTDTGAWSNPISILMPEELDTVPTTITFDISTFDVLSYYNPGKSTYKLVNGLLAMSSDMAYPACSEQYWTTGSRSQWELAMSAASPKAYQFVVFPELINPKQTKVSFYATRHLNSAAAFAVGILSDANNPSSFQAIDTIIIPTVKGYTNYTYDLSKYNFSGNFFAIKAAYDYCGSSVQVWIDDVRFYEGDGCVEPANIQAKVTGDEAIISWDDNGASSWNVLLSRREYSADDLDNLSPADYFVKQSTDKPNITISGLETGEKTYYYYIQSNCNGKLGIWTLPQSFKTECLVSERLPYTMNFDDEDWKASAYIEGFTVPCLFTVQTLVQGAEPGDLFYYPHLSTANATTGDKSLFLSASVADNYDSYIAFPQMNASLTSLQISFDMIADDENQSIEVGVMTDPKNIKTFQSVKELKSASKWSKHTVTFADYEGEGLYIAIRTIAEQNNNYIDNVTINYIIPGDGNNDEDNNNLCPVPSAFQVSLSTKTTASLSWSSTADKYRVVVASRELTIEERNTAIVAGDIIFANQLTTNSCQISGLRTSSVYYAYIQAICSDTTSSSWIMQRFFTECDKVNSYTLGIEAFENYGIGEGFAPNCYIVGNLNDTAPAINIPHCSDEYTISGAASLKLSSTPIYNGAYAITPEIDIDSISRLRVRFNASLGKYVTSQYAGKLIVGILTDPTILTYETIDTLDINDKDLLYEVRFDEYVGDYKGKMGKYVMFITSSTYNTIFIDNVQFDTIPQCVSPKVRHTITIGTPNKIDINLIGGTAPYQLKYIIGNYSEEALDSAPVNNLTTNNFQIPNIPYNTDCYIVVRSTCGSDYSDWSSVTRIKTPSLSIADLPYYDSFSQNQYVGDYNNPLDWTTYYSATDVVEQYRYPYVTSDRGDDKVVYLYSDAADEVSYMATPSLNVSDLSQCQVSFNYKPDTDAFKAQRAIIIGVVTDASTKAQVANTFQPIDTIITAGSTQNQHYTVSLASYSGSAKHVAFMVTQTLNRAKKTDSNGTYGGCYIDDVLVEFIPTCHRPSNFTLTALGDTYAQFSFTHTEATNFEVKYGASGFNPEIEGSTLTIADTKFIVNGLQANTQYDFYVRAICSDNEKSLWSLCETYTTFEQPISEFPYDNKFDNISENNNWKFSNFDSHLSTENIWNIADSLYISHDNGVSATYRNKPTNTFAYRTFDMKEGVYTISFDWKAQGDVADYMRVLLIPALSTFAEGNAHIYNFDGTITQLTAARQTYPNTWIDLNRDGRAFSGAIHADTYSRTFLITPEMAGFYRLVFYWENDDMSTSANNLSAVVDNLFIEKSVCSYPYDFEIQDINSTYLTLSWKPVGVTPKSYNVVALLKQANPDEVSDAYVACRTTVSSTSATLSNLTESTDYYIYIQADCGDGNISHWSEPYFFTTPCNPKPLGTIFSFEENEGYYLPNYDDGQPNTSRRIPDCFVTGHANAIEIPYIMDNTLAYPHSYRSGIKQLARTGDYALTFYYNSEEKIGGYAAMPLVDGNLDELQVTFWMRPFGATKNPQGDNVDQDGLNKIYARKITVGAMTNPNDPTTFQPLKVLAYPYSTEDANMARGQFVMDDPEGNNYWRKHSVPLKGAKGKFIAFKNELYDGCEYNQMYIDDVVVNFVSDCQQPYGAIIEEATATTARLNIDTINSTGTFEVQISLNEEFTDLYRTDIVTSFPAMLADLAPGTDYYIRTRKICGQTNYSDWSATTNCITAYSTLYSTEILGTFNTKSYTPRHWQRSCGTSADDIFSRTGSAMITDASSPLGWTVKDNHLATYIASTQTRQTNPYCWIFSSSIELPNSKVVCQFDLSLTDDDGIHAPDTTINNRNDKFYVVISDDNGRSWQEHNKFTWTNDGTGDYDYNNIPLTPTTYTLDLSKYAGKVIRIAFYTETYSTITSELHVRNLRVNSYVQTEEQATICQTEDYNYQTFSCLSTQLSIGKNQFIYHKPATNQSANDTLCNILLNVLPLSITSFEATICSGDIYQGLGFNNLTRSGVYKQKLKAANGCDSILCLNLTVNPTINTILTDTICFGGTYTFGGVEYNRTGRYVDTLQNVYGCDSIVTLLLNVRDAIRTEQVVSICSGKSYQFGTQTITTSGTYTETFQTSQGCDSIVTLIAHVADNLRTIYNEFICLGETYTGHGFSGIPLEGTYTLPLTSSGGCDSTIVLNLMVLSEDTIEVNQKITTADLPYTFADKTFDINTAVGTYTHQSYIQLANCAAIVNLTLDIETPVDVDNIKHTSTQFVIYPNPAQIGEHIYLQTNMSAEVLSKSTIRIYNMLGQTLILDASDLVFNSSYVTLNSTIFPQRGIYIIHITLPDSTVYHSKLIIE